MCVTYSRTLAGMNPAGSLVWASDPARPAGSSLATWTGLGPAQKNSLQKLFQKNM